MGRKNISDMQVLQAYVKSKEFRGNGNLIWPETILMNETGECEKVCYAAMERAENRGYIDYGVSLRAGWVTEKGKELLNNVL